MATPLEHPVTDVLAQLAAMALALTFAVAAAAKLADRPATARGLRALGVPAPYPLAVAVPVLEVVLALTLVCWPAVGGGAAVVLLAVFSALLATRLAQGVHAPCACFGGLGGPLSWRQLARNGVLAGLGLVALAWSRRGLASPAAALVGVGAVVLAGAGAAAWSRRR